jgi:Cu(I)/Ag(I) efflux system membrane fusion protein
MNAHRNWVIALVPVALIAGGAGYYFGHAQGSAPMGPVAGSQSQPAMTPETRTPTYYQDPAGKAEYSPTPKKTADGRAYKPVYDDASGSVAAPSPLPTMSAGKGKLLYYRNPMGQPDTSPMPKKDSMGMDYIPVYENEGGAEANIVQVSPERVQMLGVRTTIVQMRGALARTIRATGSVQFDERRLAAVTTKVGGWVEKLDVAATGEAVRAGQPLLELYSPDIVAAEQEYLVAFSMGGGGQSDMTHGDLSLLANAAVQRLRALDVPPGEIQRLQRTGTATRRIAVLAPADGIVTEKDAVLGMHFDPGTTLYKTAGLSTVWLMAQVQEQDIGQIRPGQAAHATLVAFPGRVFDGVVDFVYPTLSPDTRSAKVRIVIPNKDNLLRADMYATVDIGSGPSAGVATMLAVPDSAIIDSGARQVVLVVKGAGRFEPRVVRLGARGDGYAQILGGLKQGEEVVTSANFLIDAESNLRAALQSFTPADKSSEGAK